MVDLDRVRHVGRVVQVEHPSVGHVNPVDDRRRGRDQVQVEFARQPLLDDFQVQQAEKAAAEAETERRRGFRLVDEAGVVEAQFREAVAQLFVIGGIGREQAAEHDRLHRLEAGERLEGRAAVFGDRVADPAIGDRLDAGGDKADLAGAEFGSRDALRGEHTHALDLMRRAGRHQPDLLAGDQLAVLDPHQDHDAEIRVVPAIDQQRLERRIDFAPGRRQAGDQGFEHVLDAEAGLGRDHQRVRGVEADHVLDLRPDAIRSAAGRSILFSTGTISCPAATA